MWPSTTEAAYFSKTRRVRLSQKSLWDRAETLEVPSLDEVTPCGVRGSRLSDSFSARREQLELMTHRILFVKLSKKSNLCEYFMMTDFSHLLYGLPPPFVKKLSNFSKYFSKDLLYLY